jgi:hypothetical protein
LKAFASGFSLSDLKSLPNYISDVERYRDLISNIFDTKDNCCRIAEQLVAHREKTTPEGQPDIKLEVD